MKTIKVPADRLFKLSLIEGAFPRTLRGYFFFSVEDSNRLGRVSFSDAGAQVNLVTVATSAQLIQEETSKQVLTDEVRAEICPDQFTESVHDFYISGPDQIVAISDFGRPWIIDPVTLKTVSPVGSMSEWGAFGPKEWVDPLVLKNGDVKYVMSGESNCYFFNYTGGSVCQFYKNALAEMISALGIDADLIGLGHNDGSSDCSLNEVSKIVSLSSEGLRQWDILVNGKLHSTGTNIPHQIAVGAEHIIMMIGNIQPFENEVLFKDSSRLLVVRQKDLVVTSSTVEGYVISLPETAYYMDSFVEKDRLNIVSLHSPMTLGLVQKDDVTVLDKRFVEDWTVGRSVTPLCSAYVLVSRLDSQTMGLISQMKVSIEDWGPMDVICSDESRSVIIPCAGFDLATCVKRVWDQVKESGHLTVDDPKYTSPSLVRLSMKDFELIGRYQFPDGVTLETTTLIPSSGLLNNEFVMVTISQANLTQKVRSREIWVFDLDQLEQGPLCKLGGEDFDVIPGHTKWTPHVLPYSRAYKIDLEKDLSSVVSLQSPEVQQYFKEVVFPSMKVSLAEREKIREEFRPKHGRAIES